MANPWQPTTSENLPHGEVVEVRWGEFNSPTKCRVIRGKWGTHFQPVDDDDQYCEIMNTEWRYPVGVDKDGC